MKIFHRILGGTPVRVSGGILEEISGKCHGKIYGEITGIPAAVFGEKKYS